MKVPRSGRGVRGMFVQYRTDVVSLCFFSRHETRTSSATHLVAPPVPGRRSVTIKNVLGCWLRSLGASIKYPPPLLVRFTPSDRLDLAPIPALTRTVGR